MISERISDDIPPYIRRYTSPNENFEYGYPNSNAFLQFCLKLEHQTISVSISQDILSQIFDVIQSDVTLQKQVH